MYTYMYIFNFLIYYITHEHILHIIIWNFQKRNLKNKVFQSSVLNTLKCFGFELLIISSIFCFIYCYYF